MQCMCRATLGKDWLNAFHWFFTMTMPWVHLDLQSLEWPHFGGPFGDSSLLEFSL